MAVLALPDNHVWHGSGAILALIVDRLNASGEFPRYRQQFSHVLAGWNDLDLSDATVGDLVKLELTISTMVSEVRRNGPNVHGGDVHYSGLIARLDDLQTLLTLASSDRR